MWRRKMWTASTSSRDNWERLVAAVIKRDQIRQLCHQDSITTVDSDFSERSLSLRSVWSFPSPQLPLKGIETDHMSSFLEKTSENGYMVGARGLSIVWAHDNSRYWRWTSHPDSRFSEVAQLKYVCWLEITGCINTQLLSSKTIYGAYLVFKLDEVCYGLESSNALVRFVDDKIEGSDARAAILNRFNTSHDSRVAESVPVRRGDGLTKAVALLHLQPGDGSGQQPARRDDGWMEVEMGSFYNGGGDNGDVEVMLLGVEGLRWKSGLIVQGIEFRPKP